MRTDMFNTDRLARVIDRIGASAALAALARRPGLLVLAYHRIGDASGQPFDDELFSASADGFREQLRYLNTHFAVLDADALMAATRHGHLQLDAPSALITFDDGYRDNCDVALPILQEQGLSAVFFVAAGYIDDPRLTWWDRVAYIVKTTERPSLTLTYPQSQIFDIAADGPGRVIYRLLRLYKQTPAIDQQAFFAQLEHSAAVGVDPVALGRDLFMTWEHVRTLARAGMEIGGHTYNHPVLSRVTADTQRHELTHARQRIEAETAMDVRLMAYPVGGRDAFTPETQQLAAGAGYRAAFSYYGGVNRPGHSDLFDLRREAIDRDDSLPLFRYRMSATNLWGSSHR